MKLDKSPFVVVSVIGQELLTAGHHTASVVVLEAALKIGTCSLKLRGSVFSALSSAHWSLGNTEKSTGYMQQDLEVAKTLGTVKGFSCACEKDYYLIKQLFEHLTPNYRVNCTSCCVGGSRQEV